MIEIGRKGVYEEWLTPDGLLQVTGWARDGLTDQQIAGNIGIGMTTFYRWQEEYREFREAIKEGKKPVDIQVENALLKRALGYDYEEITTEAEEIPTGKLDKDGNPIVKQKKHIRKTKKMVVPDVTAQIFWLKNRRPGRWRDKVEAAPDNSNELLQSLIELERRSQS